IEPTEPYPPQRPTIRALFEKGCTMASRLHASRWVAAILLVAAVFATSAPAKAQIQMTSADGKIFKIGILAQPQLEDIDVFTSAAANNTEKSDNIFLRRIRLMANFTLSKQLTVFFDTDSPNLGKGNPDGSKNNADMFVQDVVITYAFSKEFQL